MTIPKIETVHTTEAIHSRIAQLAQEVDEAIGERNPLILSLLSGSFIFVADFVRAIERPLRYEFVQTLYGAADQDGILDIRFPIEVDVSGELVLLIKDVVDTGLTEAYLRTQLEDRGAAEVQIAALIDMPDQRRNEIQTDFRAFEARREGILVGYGMKRDGLHGNLPHIGRLPNEA